MYPARRLDTSVSQRRKANKTNSPWVSRLDAGAAAENVHLTATDMGLTLAFFTSMSQEGVKELLDMPDHCRPEIVVILGYPGERISPARRTPLEGRVTFVDRQTLKSS